MFPIARMNAHRFIRKDINNLKIVNGKYIPKYDPPRNLILEQDFLKLFFENKAGIKKFHDEHEIINNLVDTEAKWFSQQPFCYNYLLFIHWYERKYKRNVINKNILINLNIFLQFIPTSNNDNKISKFYTQEEVLEIISFNIESLFKSKTHENYSLYYEVFCHYFPNIESFSFQELYTEKFLNYLLKLYPNISGISTNKFHYIRYSYEDMTNYNFTLGIESGISFLNKYSLPSFLPNSFNEFGAPIREIENILRTTKGLPKIGEGWISETTLYYEIKNALPDFEVIHHGKPNWLGRQHFDIWIPEINCAVEFQGQQHDEPIAFFGGEVAFKENQNRDQLKREKSELNNVLLIEVRTGYDINEIINKIKALKNKT
jgi:hypothetical protein